MKTLILAVLALISLDVHAEPARRPRMIEIGGGFAGNLNGGRELSDNLSVLVRLAYRGASVHRDQTAEYFVARFSGKVALGVEGQVPYLDIDFTPVAVDYRVFGSNGVLDPVGVGIDFAPIRVTRDLQIDRDLNVTAAVIGAHFRSALDVYEDSASKIQVYAKTVADALGYRAARFAKENRQAFDGLHLMRLGGEVGIQAVTPNGDFKVRFAVGNTVEGAIDMRGDALLDNRAYAELVVDVHEFFRIFAEFSVSSAFTGGQDDGLAHDRTTMRALSGFAILF